MVIYARSVVCDVGVTTGLQSTGWGDSRAKMGRLWGDRGAVVKAGSQMIYDIGVEMI